MEVHDQVNVVIIGGGTTGLRAGTELASSGVSSLILSKGTPCRGIVGLNALLEEVGDTRELFLGDTLKAAAEIGETVLAENMIDNSRLELDFLEKLGLEFLHEGRYRPRRTSGNSAARTVYTTDKTGEDIINVLTEAYIGGGGRIEKNRRAVSIIKTDNMVSGVLTVDSGADFFHLYPCNAVIIASGGLGNLYTHSTNNSSLSGDGLILALNAGALLRDMEFVQFEPFALQLPGNKTFFSLSFLLEDKPRIYCEQGKTIFADGEVETLSKAQISLRLFERIAELRKAGKTGRLFFDCTHIFPERLQLHGNLLDLCSRFGLSLEKDPLPFTPAQHYMLGGIDVNERYETSVQGLFAAGETAGGTHGADRLAGNSALDALVSGTLAAGSAMQYLQDAGLRPDSECLAASALLEEKMIIKGMLSTDTQLISTAQELQQLQDLMWDHAGIIRCEKGLSRALEKITGLRQPDNAACNLSRSDSGDESAVSKYIKDFLSRENRLLVAEMIVTSALMRLESRGGHYRSDFPHIDTSLSCSIKIYRNKDQKVCYVL